MYFSKLSEYLSKLESIASRNTMVEILAQLFKEADKEEIDKIIYLTQGRVTPLYESLEFQMADKMVAKAIARAYDIDENYVTSEYKKIGDMGSVAQSLGEKSKSKSKDLSVGEVFLKLKLITEISGEGSVDKKIAMLAEIFNAVDSLSAKYIVRIVLDKLRLGFSDMTVLEGLSWMLDETKKHKDAIESAYNVRPDLGHIASLIKINGLKDLSYIEPRIGTPILGMRAERAKSAEEILEKTKGACAVEPKLDGLRTQLHMTRSKIKDQRSKTQTKNKQETEKEWQIKLFSRGLENVTEMYPDLVKAALEELDVEEVILDGEAIGFDPKTDKYVGFQQTTQRKRKYDVEAFAKDIPVKLVVFDCLFLNGENLIDKPYEKRRAIVEKLTNGNKIIISAQMKKVDQSSDLKAFFNECVNQNLEGVMAKTLDGVYQAGARGWNWIKLKKSYESKLSDTIDAVVMGLDYGQGKRNEFGVGAFLVGVYDKKDDAYRTISKIGTGLTDEEWKKLAITSKELVMDEMPPNYLIDKTLNCDVWLKPKIVGEFLCDELTKSPMHTAGWAMRFPRLVRWREDKKPQDTTSVREIEKIVEIKPK